MTYNFKETHSPMKRIQMVLWKHHEDGCSYKELAERCSTTPATIKKWIAHGPDLKWYSLMDICVGMNLELKDILKDTRWEKLV